MPEDFLPSIIMFKKEPVNCQVSIVGRLKSHVG